ncbi:autotransporter adhesin, partial [Actinobacillus minor 202]
NGSSITTSGIDAADNKITNVTNGTVSADSQDAVNGSQLYSVQTVADSALQTFTTSVNGVNVETISKDNNDVGFVNG